MRPEQWEPPDPPKLLVSAKRVAQELDVPLWKANEICWCLDRRFYPPGQGHCRVARASLEAFKELLAQGLTMSVAPAVMWKYHQEDALPPPIGAGCDGFSLYWSSKRWRRRRRF
ncbi:MAG: hypothetical protein M3Z50_14980 [Actinomycetota bacterium]|nr:hypothetical protein [Actinomycetota bacterium]